MLYVLYIRLFFFFFKQKTAYEMRISDWSSDVCSSDLFWKARCSVSSGMVEDAACLWISPDWVLSNVPVLSIMPAVVVLSAVICSSTSLDRKSVVKGKSVSVRVDLGGRRIFKKKKDICQ